jgi:hypothetical protein
MLKVTVPSNPLTGATAMVEAGDWPALAGEGEVADIAKSWKRKSAVVEWVSEPLIPVSVSV